MKKEDTTTWTLTPLFIDKMSLALQCKLKSALSLSRIFVQHTLIKLIARNLSSEMLNYETRFK